MKFIDSSDIVLGGGYPKWDYVDKHIILLLVFKYKKGNALCHAAEAYNRRTSNSRKKRATSASGVVLAGNEAAMSQELVLEILGDEVM